MASVEWVGSNSSDGKLEEMAALSRMGRRLWDNCKTDLKEIQRVTGDWMQSLGW